MKKDGLHIPENLLAENAKRLKAIPSEHSGKVISLKTWASVSGVAAALALIVSLAWPATTNEGDPFASLTGDDIYSYYEAGLFDIEHELLLEYAAEDDFSTEINLLDDEFSDSDLESILDDFNEDELYNYWN